ncbi:hypothetical protein [Hymenobacter sediminicola]|uniref:Uncharacterized protein n=1 Tax=Hymenobacter sediminicola TaxID=2761579 RepID=A0A7G7W3Q2_9BACT|nr:hypothetical protein [Hymenobacter sediminicola]QNH60995.1 hypothetical protein H4317_12475 [Hymenobacter sediminicola]
MSKQFEAIPKNNPCSTSIRQIAPVKKACIVDTYSPIPPHSSILSKDPVQEIERCLTNFKGFDFNQVASILGTYVYNHIQQRPGKSFIDEFQYNSFVELSRSNIKKSDSIVSPAVNAMLLTIGVKALRGIRLTQLIGIAFFSAYENSKSYGEMFLNETLNNVKSYRLEKSLTDHVINICKAYRDKYILSIADETYDIIEIDKLLIGVFKKSDLDSLLIHLEVIDSVNKTAIRYAGKARGKVSGFTAAYRVLEDFGFAERTLYPDKWASVFRECYQTTLVAKTARYTMKGHHTQRSKAFEKQFTKAYDWVIAWKAKQAGLL